jgi:predicted RNA methylase
MRIQQNLQVINAISQKNFNPELLEKYSGFGGIGNELAEYNYYKKLNAVISKQEIAEIKATAKTAYYTPEFLVNFIYKALDKLGFKGGNIIEPAAGTGVFIKHMPKAIKENSKITAIECEPIGFKVLKTLHPDIKCINSKFEDTALPNNSFDLVIGNPPFSNNKAIDSNNKDLTKTVLTDYFVARGVRLLKKGGILAFVVNQYVLDMIRGHIRDVIAKEGASLLAAYRLPDNIFTGARVTTDVIFITKGINTNKWINTKPYKLKNHVKHINEYYINNPRNISGKLDVINVREKTHLVCQSDSNLTNRLSDALKTFPTNLNNISINPLNKNLDLDTRANNYLNNLLSKYWDNLIKKINLRRNLFLFDNILLKIQIPNINITHIKSNYSINFNKNKTDTKNTLNKIPLDKKDYYLEINLSFKDKIIYNDIINIESIIETFFKDHIKNKFKYKLYFSYK